MNDSICDKGSPKSALVGLAKTKQENTERGNMGKTWSGETRAKHGAGKRGQITEGETRAKYSRGKTRGKLEKTVYPNILIL